MSVHPRDLVRRNVNIVVAFLVTVAASAWGGDQPLKPAIPLTKPLPDLRESVIVSSLDGTRQGIRFWNPAGDEPRPLLISLHTWSSNFRQDRGDWVREAVSRDWIYLQPDFRGPNNRPEACGSNLARQDVLDALDWALGEFKVDETRVYLAGVSGGGHMTMLMSGVAPQRFSAASAWVGVSDLHAWYEFHAAAGQPDNYRQMIANCCGGPPGLNATIDAEYVARSPLMYLSNAIELPLDLNAGVNDGHAGSVPISHTLLAYNAVVTARGEAGVSAAEINELLTQRRLSRPLTSDLEPDASYGREIQLRRRSGPTRVTIFEGGHEAIPAAPCEWLSQQQRAIRRQ